MIYISLYKVSTQFTYHMPLVYDYEKRYIPMCGLESITYKQYTNQIQFIFQRSRVLKGQEKCCFLSGCNFLFCVHNTTSKIPEISQVSFLFSSLFSFFFLQGQGFKTGPQMTGKQYTTEQHIQTCFLSFILNRISLFPGSAWNFPQWSVHLQKDWNLRDAQRLQALGFRRTNTLAKRSNLIIRFANILFPNTIIWR